MISEEELVQALVLTGELMGRQLSVGAAKMMLADLAGYDRDMVAKALSRLRREGGRFAVDEILRRLDDGRPGADEAWAMLPFDEGATVVWTDEMAEAWGIARPLFDARDRAGAQRAFREAYTKRVMEAREQRKAPRWWASLGSDKGGREAPLLEAVQRGRLTAQHVDGLLQHSNPQAAFLLEAAQRAVAKIAA